ncbi:MAG: hypothetical protein ACXVJD_18280 [Mucilaginibacter sp.]
MEAAAELFKIEKLTHEAQMINATLAVNPHSPIFKGHFPGQPVVPGACMLQLVKDILEDVLENKIQLKKASQLKFIRMIDPTITRSVQLELSYKYVDGDAVSINARLTDSDEVCFKFQGIFVNKV